MKEPKVIEVYADNGEHSHYQLIDEIGEILWSEDQSEVGNNAVLPDVSNEVPVAVPCKCGKNFNPYMDGGYCWDCKTGSCC